MFDVLSTGLPVIRRRVDFDIEEGRTTFYQMVRPCVTPGMFSNKTVDSHVAKGVRLRTVYM